MSDTPEADVESYDAIANTNSALLADDVQEVVSAKFARSLERRLRTAEAALVIDGEALADMNAERIAALREVEALQMALDAVVDAAKEKP